MRALAVSVSIVLTVLIVFFLTNKRNQEPLALAVNIPDVAPEPLLEKPQPVIATDPSTTLMPEPVLIVEPQNVSLITDEKLRRFVARNAAFNRDKVLYFEWRGGPQDKMEGTTVSDLETKDKRYVISLKQTQGESMLHRQVFIVPRSYTYEVEISK